MITIKKTNLTVEKKDTLVKVVMFKCGGAVQQRQRMFHSLITSKHNYGTTLNTITHT